MHVSACPRVHVWVPTRAQDGRMYYYNAGTQVTQWEMPADFEPAHFEPAHFEPSSAPPTAADEWLQTTRSLSLSLSLSLSRQLGFSRRNHLAHAHGGQGASHGGQGAS